VSPGLLQKSLIEVVRATPTVDALDGAWAASASAGGHGLAAALKATAALAKLIKAIRTPFRARL
jgi:hypothetical protein